MNRGFISSGFPALIKLFPSRYLNTARQKRLQDKKELVKRVRKMNGFVAAVGPGSCYYFARIIVDAVEINTGLSDLPTALEYLVILTSVKQKMLNPAGDSVSAPFEERLQGAVASSAHEHGRTAADLNLRFSLRQRASIFFGRAYQIQSPRVRSIEAFGRIRSCLAPFRAFARYQWGRGNIFWHHSPKDLEVAWQQIQVAIAEAWSIAGADSTNTLRKVRDLYETDSGLKSKPLRMWELQHMTMQDERRLKERKSSKQLEYRERQQMARHDKNKHRPKRLRGRNELGRLERWERRQMAMEDKTKHPQSRLRGSLRTRSHDVLARDVSTLQKLLVRWGLMLKREQEDRDKRHRRVLRQHKSHLRRVQAEKKRLDRLSRQRLRELQRSRREAIRKRMRTDLMGDILGGHGCNAGGKPKCRYCGT
ncbi:DnaJ protein-like 2, partial [Durusdinium trenchii]